MGMAGASAGGVGWGGALTWGVLQDEGAELVSGVQHAAVATCLARVSNRLFFGVHMLRRKKKMKN